MATVIGTERLLGHLNNIANMDLTKKMNKATIKVQSQAKELAPVDTGRLKGSIHTKVKKDGKNIIGKVYTNVKYAPFVEFGTGIKGNGSYPYKIKDLNLEYKEDWQGMRAQPYMYPALKRNKKYIRELFKNGVIETVRKGK